MTPDDLRAVLPDLTSPQTFPGLRGRVDVWRDPQGIPHVRAGSVHDAFLAQGFVHAQDRLWQMDYDRRRAGGRWAEYAGPGAVAQDALMRRCRLEASVRADYAAVNAETREVLHAYAAGVNAFIETARTLPVEYCLVESRPEPWQPWQSGAVFKVRHILMGVWQSKAWRARLVRQIGAARAAPLCPGTAPNPMLIVPPGMEYEGPAADGLAELTAQEAVLAGMPDWDGGSNNWAVAGRRTASGKPLVAGDPHRALDVPNVYYQNHVACPEFDVIGLSFPGVPGFPHFGHNAAVAWCVTHTHADCQDLYIERFDAEGRYEFRGQWRPAETAREVIHVRGGAPVEIETTATHHGPVILGEPRAGQAIALRYTALAAPNPTFEALLPMLRARSADELVGAMRPWVDPVNNFVFADVHGAIGYQTRGQVPIRSRANAWVPVPGWTGDHEWQGAIPFEALPAVRDPDTGWVATANSKVTEPEYSYDLGIDYGSDFRTRRLAEHLQRLGRATVADMARIHADRISLPARELLESLAKIEPADTPSGEALRELLAWDGAMDRESVAATLYSALRDRLMRDLMTPLLGPLAAHAFAPTTGGGVTHMARLRGRLPAMIRDDDPALLPPGAGWPEVLARALSAAVTDLRRTLGSDMATWRWGRVHATQPRHPLATSFPALVPLLNPPGVPMGGDNETVQAGSYIPAAGYALTSTSVARYAFDLGDWEQSAWVVPLGASGHPGSPHYADQVQAWSEVRLLPMRYGWARIAAEAESHQALGPA